MSPVCMNDEGHYLGKFSWRTLRFWGGGLKKAIDGTLAESNIVWGNCYTMMGQYLAHVPTDSAQFHCFQNCFRIFSHLIDS